MSALTSAQITSTAYEKFGIVAEDQEIIAFADFITSRATQEKDKRIEELEAMTDGQREVITDLENRLEGIQARIDALMMEYCPSEMTREQVANWAEHQKAVSICPDYDRE